MELRQELKQLIVVVLELEDVAPDEIQDEEPLFGEGLGLDSIDILELTVAVEKRYGVSIPDEDVGKRAFASVAALASFVSEQRAA